MAGWTIMPINRVITCDGTSLITTPTGAAVTAYPLVNLNDPDPSLLTKITPTLGSIALLFDFNYATISATDPNAEVGGIGIKNANLAGVTIQVYSHTSATFGSAVSAWGPYTLSLNSNYVDLFATFTASFKRYWWITMTGCANPTQFGAIGLGPVIDMGYPMRPENFGWESQSTPMMTAGGHLLPTVGNDPLDVKTVYFANPSLLTKAKIYDKSSPTNIGPAYNTIWRSFRERRQLPESATVYNGLSAGSGAPIFYHEGDARGRSTAGRPGMYGYWDIQGIGQNQSRDRSVVRVKITDATPKGLDWQPAY